MTSSYCEIPFLSATTIDEALTSSGSGKAALQKYRQAMRRELDPGMGISVGHAGTLQLTSVPNVACVAIANRWNMRDALKLVKIYKEEKFDRVTRSKQYKEVLSLVGEAVKGKVQSGKGKGAKAIVEIIPSCWEELTTASKSVRDFTDRLYEIFTKVDQKADQMKRSPGRLVRFEGNNALVTIETGEREELRMVDSSYLRSFGVHRNGAPFVLHEYRWSPDTTLSMYFPAFDLNHDEKAEEALLERLNKYAKPLPDPPAGLLPADFVPEESRSDSTPEPVRAAHPALAPAARAARLKSAG